MRKHQKVKNPCYLYWADQLGLLVWGEMANAYAFSPEYIGRRIHRPHHGGVAYQNDRQTGWGYSTAEDEADFLKR